MHVFRECEFVQTYCTKSQMIQNIITMMWTGAHRESSATRDLFRLVEGRIRFWSSSQLSASSMSCCIFAHSSFFRSSSKWSRSLWAVVVIVVDFCLLYAVLILCTCTFGEMPKVEATMMLRQSAVQYQCWKAIRSSLLHYVPCNIQIHDQSWVLP